MLPASTSRPDAAARAHLIANLQATRRGHWQDHHIALPGDFTPNWIQRRDDRLRI
jgi:hypothetical protein